MKQENKIIWLISLIMILIICLSGCTGDIKSVVNIEDYKIDNEDRIITIYGNAAKFAEDEFPIFHGSEIIVYDKTSHSGPICWKDYAYNTNIGDAVEFDESSDRISFKINIKLEELNTEELYYYRAVVDYQTPGSGGVILEKYFSSEAIFTINQDKQTIVFIKNNKQLLQRIIETKTLERILDKFFIN